MKEQLTTEEILAMMTTSMVVPLDDGNRLDLALKDFLEFHRVDWGNNETPIAVLWNMVVASAEIHNRTLEAFQLRIEQMERKIDEETAN
jgi:hypothetical protein